MYIHKLTKVISSKYFLWLALIIFALQALFFSFAIKYGVPPDERLHFESTRYYAEQSILDGPIISAQSPDSIPIVKVITRNASYLYYYLMSFPFRLIEQLSGNIETQALLLRLVNITLGIGLLYVLKKCLDEISDNNLLKNLSIFGLSVTGMFVWISAAVNYDNLSNLLFSLFLLFAIRFVKNPRISHFILAYSFGLATCLTKYTFLPTVGIGLLILMLLSAKHYLKNSFTKELKKLSKSYVFFGFLCTFMLFSSILAVERFGLNIIRYHSVQPSCVVIFTKEQCLKNPLYARNYAQKELFNSQKKEKFVNDLDPFSHTGTWIYSMYNNMFFYLGHKRIKSTSISELVAALAMFTTLITLLLPRQKLFSKFHQYYPFILTTIYIGMLYVFNMLTLLNYGKRFAYQGRYLLPIIVFVFFGLGLLISKTTKKLPSRTKTIFLYSWFLIIMALLLTHQPLLTFRRGVDMTWYSPHYIYFIY